MVKPFFPAVTYPPMPVLLMPPDAPLGILFVSVHDSLVGPVIIHDREGPIELRRGREVLGYHAVRT